MKKLVILLLLCAWYGNSNAATYYYTTAGGGQWQAYAKDGVPPGWPGCVADTNWKKPIAGRPHIPVQSDPLINSFVAAGLTATSLSNFIWIKEDTLWTPGEKRERYFRITFNTTNTCKKIKLHLASDEGREVYLNGNRTPIETASEQYEPFPWSGVKTIDLTSMLQCGDNCITVKVSNASLWFFFLACLEITDDAVATYPLSPSYDIDCEDPDHFTLSAGTSPAAPGVTFSWTGPNGFTSTAKDPLVTGVTKATHEGQYICTIKEKPCCTRTDTVRVIIPAHCCDAELNPKRTDCNYFSFDLSSTVVDLNCWYWVINNTIVQNGGTLNRYFGPGTYKICARYMGRARKDTNQVCCDEKCYTVTIPSRVTSTDTVRLSYCLLKRNHFVVMNPCDYAPAGAFTYSLSKKSTTGSSYVTTFTGSLQGCPARNLTEGYYRFRYYDTNGCMILDRLTLEVKPGQVIYSSCYQKVKRACADTAISPRNIHPLPETCPNCTGTDTGALVSIPGVPGAPQRWQRTYTDTNNCRSCIFLFDIIPDTTFTSETRVLAWGTTVFTMTPCDSGISYYYINDVLVYSNSAGTYTTTYVEGNTYKVVTISATGCVCVKTYIVSRECTCTDLTPRTKYILTPQFVTAGQYILHFNNLSSTCTPYLLCSSDYIVYNTNDGSIVAVLPGTTTTWSVPYPGTGSYSICLTNVYCGPSEGDTCIVTDCHPFAPVTSFMKAAPEDNTDPHLKLIPNPSSAVFTISFDDPQVTIYDRVEILTARGASVLSQFHIAAGHQYNLGSAASGTYQVRVWIRGRQYTSRLVLQQ